MATWLGNLRGRCATVHVHSNAGRVNTHDEPGTGAPTREAVRVGADALGPEATFILKMNDKQHPARCVARVAGT